MVQAVLFDVDGVLVHPWRFRAALARGHGITPDMTVSSDLFDVLPPFLASWGWTGSVSDFVGEWLSVENAPNEAVLSVVADIRRRGIPCFVASTQERRRAQYLATEMRFNQLFDGLLFSCDVGVEKPKVGFFKTVAHRLGRSGMELLFFDDALVNVEGARPQAGWPNSSRVSGASELMWPDTRGLPSKLAKIRMEPTRLAVSYNHVAGARGSLER